MKYLTKFEQETDYQSFKGSEEFETPNVSYVTENNECYFEPKVELIENKIIRHQLVTASSVTNSIEFEYIVESDVTIKYLSSPIGNETTLPNPSSGLYKCNGQYFTRIQERLVKKGEKQVSDMMISFVIDITPSKDSIYSYSAGEFYGKVEIVS